MFAIIGIVLTFAMVFGGYVMASGKTALSLELARTLAVNTLVFGQLFYLFNSRHLRSSSLRRDTLLANRVAWGAAAVLLWLQITYVYAPFMHRLFASAPLSPWLWLIPAGIGLAVLFVGVSGTLVQMFKVEGEILTSNQGMLMILSLVIGSLVGAALNLEQRLENLGGLLQRLFRANGQNSTFVEGFVSATILYCVGAMAILGALEDGLTGNATTLYAKSILDGTVAIRAVSTGLGQRAGGVGRRVGGAGSLGGRAVMCA